MWKTPSGVNTLTNYFNSRSFSKHSALLFPFSSALFLLPSGFDEVAVESHVNIHVVAVDGVLPVPLEQAYPHGVVALQLQHHALALHDGAVAGLGVDYGPLCLVLHDVQVRLLEVPRVDVDVEEVDPRDAAEELALEHVEAAFQVDEDRVEYHRLVGVVAVQGLTTGDREGGVLMVAGVSWRARLALTAL